MILPRLQMIGVVPLIATMMYVASGPTANLSYFLISAYALLGRAQAIRALTLSWLFTMLSPAIAVGATISSIGSYGVIACSAFTILMRSHTSRFSGATVMTLLLGIFLIMHGFVISPIVDVSALKALVWGVTMATVISAWQGLSGDEQAQLSGQIFLWLIVIVVVSLSFIASPSGYLTNGTGFQGILNQPQAFGAMVALLGAWTASQMLGNRNPSWLEIMLFGGCLFLTLMSESRTAGLALVLAIVIGGLTVPFLSGRSVRDVLPGLRNRRVQFVIMIGLIGVIFSGPILSGVMTDYMVKRSSAQSLMAAYEESRGMLIWPMLENIQENPMLGSGFGIASDPYSMRIKRDPIFGLPMGAPVEKGVMPLAVLEEVGITGFVLVAMWIWMLLRRSSYGGMAPVTVCYTALLLNMGEATLFSTSGFGLLPLILLGWAFSDGQKQKKLRH